MTEDQELRLKAFEMLKDWFPSPKYHLSLKSTCELADALVEWIKTGQLPKEFRKTIAKMFNNDLNAA